MKRIFKHIKRKINDTLKENDSIYKRTFDQDAFITIACEDSFTLWYQAKASDDFIIVAPLDISARFARYRVVKGSAIELITEGNFTIDVDAVPSALEHPTGEKLIEILENKPDNIKDIVRAQVLAELSVINGQIGGDTIDEFDDFSDMEDEFNDTPLTEHEFKVMKEEFEILPIESTAKAEQSEVVDDQDANSVTNTDNEPQPETT